MSQATALESAAGTRARAAWPARDWLVAGGFALLVFALRFASFSRAVIDQDESLFLLMGRSILRGEIPYTTVWEHSPLGTPALFALGQAVFGQSVVAIRILTWLAVTVECVLLYRLGGLLGAKSASSTGWSALTGTIAGLIYAVFSLNNTGLAAHRELFLAPLATLAVLLYLSGRGDADRPQRIESLRLVAVGLVLGLALQLKLLYVFEFVALWLIAMASLAGEFVARPRRFLAEGLRQTSLLAAGPLAIIVLAGLGFAAIGRLDVYLEANFRSASAYAASEPFALSPLVRRLVSQFTHNAMPWVGAIVALVYFHALRRGERVLRQRTLYLLLWLGCAVLSACFSRKLFPHYWLETLPPLSILTAMVATHLVGHAAGTDRVRRGFLLILLLVPAMTATALPPLVANAGLAWRQIVRSEPVQPDTASRVAEYLRSRVQKSDAIYVVDYEPVLYYLVDVKIPTKYSFPPHLIALNSARILGRDAILELQDIMAQRPLYVIRLEPPSGEILNAAFEQGVDTHLQQGYDLERAITGTDVTTGLPIVVQVYRRR